MSVRLLDPDTLQPVDLDADALAAAGIHPTPYARHLLTELRHQRARLAAHADAP